MKYLILLAACLLYILPIFAQTMCDYNELFLEPISEPPIFGNTIPYCMNCPDEEGILRTYEIILHTPIDAFTNLVPLRPHVMYVHGFGPNTNMADPIAGISQLHSREVFGIYGFSASTLMYRQDVHLLDLTNLCNTPEIEVIKTHYRAIQDMRKAVDLLFQNPTIYGIDTTNFFLYGNSQGATAILNGVLATNEDEWLSLFPEEYHYIKEELGEWLPMRTIKGIVSIAGVLYGTELLDTNDNTALFLGHGTCDEAAPYDVGTPLNCPTDIMVYGSRSIACKAKATNNNYSLHSINGLGHGWDDEGLQTEAGNTIRAWLKNQMICGTPVQESFTYEMNLVDCESGNTTLNGCSIPNTTTDLLEIQEKCTLFPNPVSTTLNINLPSTVAPIKYLTIINTRRKIVQKTNLNHSYKKQTTIPINHLPNGIYYLNIITQDQESLSQSFVVNK